MFSAGSYSFGALRDHWPGDQGGLSLLLRGSAVEAGFDRLIERQLKNVRLLMQSYDSVRFAPQIHKRMALEIEQLEQQLKQAREDQRLEVDRQ